MFISSFPHVRARDARAKYNIMVTVFKAAKDDSSLLKGVMDTRAPTPLVTRQLFDTVKRETPDSNIIYSVSLQT